ncbi:MAG: aspartate--tRNA ligase [Actinomycetota bacterium]
MRTHWCGELRKQHEGQSVTLAGWVHKRRDHGGVIFLDLRDREGIAQVTMHPSEQPDAYKVAEDVRSEYVVVVEGTVRSRPPGAENPNIPTGEIEVTGSSIKVLAKSETPPFPIDGRVDVGEEVRLKYRYLDLRRPETQARIILRHKVVAAIRRFLDAEGFIDIETPLLSKSTPEGARDYLVPSRLYPGKFYALLQSPQLFKQLLMISGFDRYYQIVRCFRDEDPRADRQADFTQLDLEMSFVDQEDVLGLVERLIVGVLKEAMDIDVSAPFDRLTFDESMARYGIDRPDRRFGLGLVDLTDVFRDTQINVFRGSIDKGGIVKGITVPGAESMSRKELDALVAVAKSAGAAGLAWVGFTDEGISSPLSKFMTDQEITDLKSASEAASGDLVLIAADIASVAEPALGALRNHLGASLGLIEAADRTAPGYWQPVWVVDMPLVEFNEREQRWDSVHHPFTSPATQDLELLDSDPGKVKAKAYDLTLHGIEIAGGSIRIHDPALQRKIFALIGLDEETVQQRFGWFVEAFDYGAPPHGGIASGIERLLMALTDTDNIRDVMAFPKTSMMTDLLTGAPDAVDEKQLNELGIKIVVDKKQDPN